jgi:hypothetical protein
MVGTRSVQTEAGNDIRENVKGLEQNALALRE